MKTILSFPFLLFFLIISSQSVGQTEQDPEKARLALEKALLAAEKDEDEEDSIKIYLQNAMQEFLLTKLYDNLVSSGLKTSPQLYRLGYSDVGVDYLISIDKEMQKLVGNAYPGKTDLHYQLGRGHYFQRDFERCAQVILANMIRLDSTSVEYANHCNLLGVVYRNQGKLLQSVETLEKTLKIRIRVYGNKHNQVASVMNNIGVAYRNIGLYGDALDYYQRALEIRKELLGKEHNSVATLYLNMGVLFSNKGEYEKTIEYFQKALDIFEQKPASFEKRIADIFNNLGLAYQKKGAFQESEAFYQQAINKYQSSKGENNEEIGNVLLNWANLRALQGEHEKEIDLNQRALQLYQQTLDSNDINVLDARNNLGIAYASNGEFTKALNILEGLETLLSAENEHLELLANINNDIADIHFKNKDFNRAKTYSLKALALFENLLGAKNYRLAYTYNRLASIEENLGNPIDALKYIQKALAANHQNYEEAYTHEAPPPQGFYKYDYFVESLIQKAKLTALKGDASSLLQAKLYYDIADSVLVQVRDELISVEDKITLSQKIFDLSQAAIENQIKLAQSTKDTRYLESAFQISEKSKSNVLSQSIQANQARVFAGIPDSLVNLGDRLRSDINYYKLRLAELPDSLKNALFQEKLFLAQQNHKELIKKLEEKYPLYYQLKYDRSVPRIPAIQFVLPEKTALISYFVGENTLYSFVITKDNFEVFNSSINEDFLDQLIGFRKTITYVDDIFYEDYVELGQELYNKLFPFKLNSGIESLIIVGDGSLSKIPFEALLNKQVDNLEDLNYGQLPYLIKSYDIKYELSATMYFQEQSFESSLDKEGEGLLAIAPVFAEPQELNLFASEIRDPVQSIRGEGDRGGVSLDDQFVRALPATAEEVTAIAEVFRENRKPANTYLFQEANEKSFKQAELNKRKYIHIATHGFINETQPDLSGLMMYPDTSSSEDHILYSGEVYGLELNADLVVLSACETGLGRVASGEGLLGLSRAFRYAGADRLVVSLWKVEDKATANLMTGFYRTHLKQKNADFASSIRTIKLDMIKGQDYNHPYYWSAFVLIGSK